MPHDASHVMPPRPECLPPRFVPAHQSTMTQGWPVRLVCPAISLVLHAQMAQNARVARARRTAAHLTLRRKYANAWTSFTTTAQTNCARLASTRVLPVDRVPVVVLLVLTQRHIENWPAALVLAARGTSTKTSTLSVRVASTLAKHVLTLRLATPVTLQSTDNTVLRMTCAGVQKVTLMIRVATKRANNAT